MTQDQFVARTLAEQNALRMMAEEYKSKDYLAQLSEKEVKIIRKALVRISLDLPKDDVKCALELLERLSESSTGYPSKSNWKNGYLYFPTDKEKTYLVKDTRFGKDLYFLCSLNENKVLTGRSVDSSVLLLDDTMFLPKTKFWWIELP